jgi:hypothetical protein
LFCFLPRETLLRQQKNAKATGGAGTKFNTKTTPQLREKQKKRKIHFMCVFVCEKKEKDYSSRLCEGELEKK